MSPPRLTMYSDYVCPFCYLGKRSLQQYREARDGDLAVEWHPFDLRGHKRASDGSIDHSIDDGKDEAYFEQVRENVARLKEEYGANEMRSLDEIPDKVDSFNAQLASLVVHSNYADMWPAFDDAIFEALWVEGRDIGDPAVLASVADDVGLDAEEIRERPDDEAARKQLREQFENAQEEGITGVPTFVYDGHSARGAVPPGHLERLIEGY